MTLEEPGLLVGDSDTAVRVAEVNSSYIGDVSNTDLAFAGTQPYTMTTLMNVDVLTIGRTVVNWRTAASTVGWRVSVTPAGEVVFERHDGASSDQISGSYTTSTTHHVAVTYDGATMRLYVDGAQVASTASTRSQPGTGVLRIARLDLEGLDGVLDEMALWDQELSAAQIAKQNSVARGSS